MPKHIFPLIVVVLITAILTLCSWRWGPAEAMLERFLEDELARWFLLVWTAAAIPMAFWMPRIRASFFGRSWRVPSQAYVLPGWLISLIIAFAWGQTLAMLVLASFSTPHMFWLFASSLLITITFSAGAWHRLKRPREEFEIPLFYWYPRIFR